MPTPQTYEGAEPHIDSAPMLAESEIEDGRVDPEEDVLEQEPDADEVVEPEVEPEEPDATEVDDQEPADLALTDEQRKALEFGTRLQQPDAQMDFMIEGMLQLGYTLDEVEDILSKRAAAAAGDDGDDDDEDDDRIVTMADLKAERQRQEARETVLRREESAQNAVQIAESLLPTFKLDGEQELSERQAKEVVRLADEYLDRQGIWTSAQVREALTKGWDDFQAIYGEAKAQTIKTKAAQKARTPKPLKGGTAGGDTEGEAADVASGIQRARARLRKAGVID